MESGGGRAGHRRARRAAQARGPADGREQARHRDLVHGRHAAHHRQQQCPRLLHPAARTRQHGRERRRHQHLPWPRQRPGRHGHGSRCDDPAGLLRPGRRRLEALVPRLGRRLRVGQGPLRRQGVHGEGRYPGVALVRRRARGQGQPRPAEQRQGHGVLGPCPQLADPAARHAAGDGQAGAAPDRRPAPDRLGGAQQPDRRRLSPALDHADGVRGLGDRVEPLAAVARAGDRAALREQDRPRDHVPVRAEVRLRERAVQAHPGRGHGPGRRGHPARDQSRRLDHRLYRPVAGAAQAAHGKPADLRQDDAEGRGRPVRRRLLRPALALLGHRRR